MLALAEKGSGMGLVLGVHHLAIIVVGYARSKRLDTDVLGAVVVAACDRAA